MLAIYGTLFSMVTIIFLSILILTVTGQSVTNATTEINSIATESISSPSNESEHIIVASIQTSWKYTNSSPTHLLASQFNPIVAHHLGLPVICSTFQPDHPNLIRSQDIEIDPFKAVEANLLFVVVGLTSQELQLEHLQPSKSLALSQASSPHTMLSAVDSLLTGNTNIEANSNTNKICHCPRLADLSLSKLSPNLVSSSAQLQWAHLLSPQLHLVPQTLVNPQIVSFTLDPSNHDIVAAGPYLAIQYGKEELGDDQFASTPPNIMLTFQECLEFLNNQLGLSLVNEAESLVREDTSYQQSYNALKNRLLAELGAILYSTQLVTSKLALDNLTQVHESHTSMYSFALTTLAPIAEHFGIQSTEFTYYSRLVQLVYHQINQWIQSAHNASVIREVVFVKESSPIKMKTQLNSNHSESSTHQQIMVLASSIQLQADLSNATSNSTSTKQLPYFYDHNLESSRIIWHICLWTSLAVIVSIYFVYKSTTGIAIQSESSLLHRMTSISEKQRVHWNEAS